MVYRPSSPGSIEGIPVIIRFKTISLRVSRYSTNCIEGIPVIIRFKTQSLLGN